MPYSKVSEARIKKLGGVPLTLDQINSIAAQADAIGGDFGWPTAIAHFKKTHTVEDGHWVEKKKEDSSFVTVQKQNGRYRIIGISTAAVPDREGETFATEAMDFDIARAKETGNYPEFRMFHDDRLGIGQVDTMRRAGIFAVDEGWSYDDPFSLACCDMIAKDTTGRWGMSRGFFTLEVSGGCPRCGTNLILNAKHMIAGFRCPTCKSVHLTYKEALTSVRFRKTRTFDDTITDIPCVPYTGVTAYSSQPEDSIMKKEAVKQRLLDAGLDETLVDERLSKVTEKQLEAMGEDIPTAEVLKEVGLEEEQPTEDGGDTEVTMEDLQALIHKEVSSAVAEALANAEIEVTMPEQKEYSTQLDGLTTEIASLKEMLGQLLQDDDTRLKQLMQDAPRAAIFRIKQGTKCAPGKKSKKMDDMMDEESTEEDMGEDGEEETAKPTKKKEAVAVFGADGQAYDSLTTALFGGEK